MLINTAAMAQDDGFMVQVGAMDHDGQNGLIVWLPGFALDDDGQVVTLPQAV